MYRKQDKIIQTKGNSVRASEVKDEGRRSETERKRERQRAGVRLLRRRREAERESEGVERQALPFLVVKVAERTSRNSLCRRRAEI